MKSIVLLSLLFGVASVAARGIRVSGGGGSISDNWDAPGTLKASMAFEIIWCFVGLVQLSYLIRLLPFIPNMQFRAPYYMLTILTMIFSLGYLLWAIETRLSTTDSFNAVNGLSASTGLFLSFIVAFQPAVILYIVHQRAFLLRASLGKTVNPLQAQIWKRIFDWSLCAILCLLLITQMAVLTNENVLAIKNVLTFAAYKKYNDVRNGFSHAAAAFIVIVAINVFVGLLSLWLAQRRYQVRDPVINRLLGFAFPFVAVYALENLITEIYSFVVLDYDQYALLLAEVIIEGICRVGITAAIISTIAAPGVSWTPPPAVGPPQPHMAYGEPGGYPNYQPGWQQPAHFMPYQPQPQPQPPQNPQPNAQPFSIPMTVSHA